jgi:hypothetical protein
MITGGCTRLGGGAGCANPEVQGAAKAQSGAHISVTKLKRDLRRFIVTHQD